MACLAEMRTAYAEQKLFVFFICYVTLPYSIYFFLFLFLLLLFFLFLIIIIYFGLIYLILSCFDFSLLFNWILLSPPGLLYVLFVKHEEDHQSRLLFTLKVFIVCLFLSPFKFLVLSSKMVVLTPDFFKFLKFK